MIGKYCGEDSPGKITSTDETGALTFKFYSDGGVTDLGWIALIDCTPTSVLPFDNEQYTRIDIFPNPTNNVFNINIEGMRADKLDISIYDIDAKQIINKNFKNISANFSTQFDLKNYANGLYIIEIKTGNKTIRQRIVLE